MRTKKTVHVASRIQNSHSPKNIYACVRLQNEKKPEIQKAKHVMVTEKHHSSSR